MKLQLYYDPWLQYFSELSPPPRPRIKRSRKDIAAEEERRRLEDECRRLWTTIYGLKVKLQAAEQELASVRANMNSNHLWRENQRLRNLADEQEIQVRGAWDRVRALEAAFESLQR